MRYSRRSFALSAAALPLLRPNLGAAQHATPSSSPTQAEFGSARDRMRALLDILPGGTLDGSLNLYWTDLERQFTQVSGDSFTDSAALMPPLGLQDRLLSRNAFEVLAPLLGFDLADIQQTLVSGNPPNEVRLYVLSTDTMRLSQTWEAAGYERRESEGMTYWTIGENRELDLNDPIQRVGSSQLNNVAVIDERTLAFAANEESIISIMATATGERQGKSNELKPVTDGLPEDAVSAWYLDGHTLAATKPSASEQLKESNIAVGAMPTIRTVCVGLTLGASSHIGKQSADATAYLLLQTDEPAMAQQVASVVDWRMIKMTSELSSLSFTNMLGPMKTEIISDDVVRFSVGGNSAQRFDFAQMIYQGDIWPLVFMPQLLRAEASIVDACS